MLDLTSQILDWMDKARIAVKNRAKWSHRHSDSYVQQTTSIHLVTQVSVRKGDIAQNLHCVVFFLD